MTSADEACQQTNGTEAPLKREASSSANRNSAGGRSQTNSVTWSPSTKSRNGSGFFRSSSHGFQKLHKSVTAVMLEHLGHDSNSVLLLPVPFDQFTRDIVNLLKTVLTCEGNIPSVCCFDQDVQCQYNRKEDVWVKKIASDSKKIVIFVCLLSIDEVVKEDPVIYKLLECFHKRNTPPSCHVLFLHVTDHVKDLQKQYHGIDIHIKHDKSYESFLRAILEGCGKDPDQESEMLETMLNSQSTEQFFKHIGHSRDSV